MMKRTHLAAFRALQALRERSASSPPRVIVELQFRPRTHLARARESCWDDSESCLGPKNGLGPQNGLGPKTWDDSEEHHASPCIARYHHHARGPIVGLMVFFRSNRQSAEFELEQSGNEVGLKIMYLKSIPKLVGSL